MLRALLLLACTAKVSAFATLPAGEQAGAGDPACADLEPEAIQAEYAEPLGEALEAGELPEGTTMASCADVAASGGCAEEEVARSCCATCALPQRMTYGFWGKVKSGVASWWRRVTSKKKPPPPSPSPPPPPPAYVITSSAELKQAVDDWFTNRNAAKTKYGAISSWDTSQVRHMSMLFQSKTFNNDDIGAWDTSQVTNMYGTFYGAKKFNGLLVWDTSKVTNMYYTFNNAEAFNSELAWDTSSVTNMHGTFYEAEAFNQPLDWDTSKVTSMNSMFGEAGAFNQQLAWDTTMATGRSCLTRAYAGCMFFGAGAGAGLTN
jgi:surface protein